jgi:hypothetical protein
MAQQYRAVPTYGQKLEIGEHTSASWYRFWQDVNSGRPPGPESGIVVTVSPFIYHTTVGGGFLIVSGGTVSAIAFSRDQVNFYATGLTAGVFPLANEDSYRITYTVKPTVTFVPM